MTVSAELEAEIHRLHHAEGWPPGTIARQLTLHVDVVRRVLGTQASPLHARKPSFVDDYVPFMRETLERWPTLRSTRVFDMLKERGFPGSPRTVREHVARLRPRREREAFLRTHPLIGEQSQVDWAFVQNVDVDGGKRALWMFVIVLSWSRALWCELCFTMDAPMVARSLVRAAHAFNGVTRQWLFDNPKTIVLERAGDAVRFHPLLLSTTTALRVQPQLCAPRRANEKGKVERAIRFVRDRALAGFAFRSIDDGNEHLKKFCTGIALDRQHPTLVGRTVRECLDEERGRLLSLPEHLPITDERRSVVVDKTAFVRFDTNDYSVPHPLVAKTLTVLADDRVLRIVDADVEVARHQRSFGRRRTVENPEHRRALVEVKRRAKDGFRRDQLCERFPAFRAVVDRWLDENRNLGLAIQHATRVVDDYGDVVFAAAVDEFVAGAYVDPAVLAVLCERHKHARSPRPTSMPLHHVDDRDVTPHDLEDYDDPKRRRH
jgi:transposase